MTEQPTDEQLRAVNYVLAGRNIFLTGRAGTGKSFTLRWIIAQLPRESTFVTASTGCAAINIAGMTYHKFSGIRLGNGTVDEILRAMPRQARLNWLACRVWIIDEISMVRGQTFDKLDEIARRMRDDPRPFGGIQIVACGDFYQCPPVNKKFSVDDEDAQQCFESEAWAAIEIQYELRTIVRQSGELSIGLVNALRDSPIDARGVVQLDEKWCSVMNYLARPLPARADGILPTRLFCTNRDVDRDNIVELNRIDAEVHRYVATDTGVDPWRKDLETHCAAPTELQLKVGAQVVLIKNSIANPLLVNGSRGIVTAFQQITDFPIVKFKNGVEQIVEYDTWEIQDQRARPLATRTQIPLKLAWAITCHRSQGMSLDYVDVNISDAFDFGIAYVALTRFTKFSGMCISGYDPKRIRNNPQVVAFMAALRLRPENQRE